jgi:hypothetical protein
MEEQQAIQLLWDEWKYRHDLFWRSLFRWAGVVVTLWVIPFVKPEVFKPWPKIALFFPAMAFILSLFSAWILGGEQRRFEMVNKRYNDLRERFLPPRVPQDTLIDRLVALPLGIIIVWVYAIALALLSALVLILLWHSI